MLVSDFAYDLPPELIARFPAERRAASRLMVLERGGSTIRHDHFENIGNYLKPDDLLVLNDTRVIPARLKGSKVTGGKVEIFLVRPEETSDRRWHCLLRGAKGVKPGQTIILSAGMQALMHGRHDGETWLVEFAGEEPFAQWLEREGEMPLPPYLQRPAGDVDRERYQTVFASAPGAVAAPTAGLHFSLELLAGLNARGVASTCLTLHTGLGTFQPVRVERVEEHRIHTERYCLSSAAAAAIQAARERKGRVVAVGTTSARTLEYSATADGLVTPGSGEADIYIYPGYDFRVVDALVTNFHLPESTLLMLVSAFAGRDFVLEAYREAIAEGYRFYSYGDAMLIL